jgi:hypothetical protein
MPELFTGLTDEEVEQLIADIDVPIDDELGLDCWNINQSQCPKNEPVVTPVVMKRKRSQCPKNEPVVTPVVMKRKRSQYHKKARGIPPSFPHVLKRLLNTKCPSIMWTHDGTGIIIISDNLPKVLSKYFKTNKIESFMRQLNLYGFKNIGGVYMHPVFNRYSKSVRSLITTFHNKKHMKLANKA